ncbi:MULTISPECIES: restriction endonuclease subunit S [unclassified Bacillus (in: firmicutes)]|uniref:restriction endonuclease subunit S n=1 Tax=unclassified Bacillus (in: firmicutes) TaxID=185979 RepID=UPI0030F7054D
MEFNTFITLGEVVDLLGDGLHGTPKYDINGEYHFINGNNLINGDIVIKENTKKVDLGEYLKYKKKLNSRTILVSINGTLGNVATYKNEKVILGKSACYFNVKKEINKDYIRYIVEDGNFQNYIRQFATGTTIKNVSLKTMRDYKFYLPGVKQQIKVVNTLKPIDNLIKTNREIIYNLEKFAQTLFKHWFIDFEFPNEQGQPYKSSGGEMVESELGEIPKNWTVITIKDVCDANKGSLSKKDNWSYINYLDTSNITNNSIENIQFIDATKDKIPSRAKRKIQPNDIVYSTVRPNQYHYGIIKEPTENMIASTGFTVLRSKGVYPNDLIYLWLTQKEVTDKLQAIAEQSTSAYPSIKADDILSMKILLPQKKELAVLAEIIEVQNKVIWNKQQENKKLSELRDTLLPKLLSGEIKIPDEVVVD